jgi:hypothetical protein
VIYLEKDVNLLDVRGEYNGTQVTYSEDDIYAYLIPPVVSP